MVVDEVGREIVEIEIDDVFNIKGKVFYCADVPHEWVTPYPERCMYLMKGTKVIVEGREVEVLESELFTGCFCPTKARHIAMALGGAFEKGDKIKVKAGYII